MAESGAFGDLNVTATDAKFALYYFLNSSPDFPLFNEVLSAALGGNGTFLVPNPVIMQDIVNVLPIVCADERECHNARQDRITYSSHALRG
jgi:hypothetical protein